MGTFFVKVHESYRNVVAICDSELLGKRFEEGKKQLDVRENFYNGDEVDEEALQRLLEVQAVEDSTFHITGPRAVGLAKEAGVIVDGNVGVVDGVPFALMLF